jgi:hypothetical protein
MLSPIVLLSELMTSLADLREPSAACSRWRCSVKSVSFWIEWHRPQISSVRSSLRSYIKWIV